MTPLPAAPLLALVLVAAPANAADAPAARATVASPAPAWPKPGARLDAPAVAFPKGMKRLRVYLDAGHGAAGNPGNTSCTCENEESFTDRVTRDLAQRLKATGHFEVRLSRPGTQPVPYKDRVAQAEAWGADVFVSLHSDARGQATLTKAADGQLCPRRDDAPGFSVLWSDEGKAALVSRRHVLAQALARRLSAAGFPAYDGADYTGLYDGDPLPGVFVDRRVLTKRVYVLRQPTMPSVIIETHHAFDFEEVARWREPRTLEVFAAVVASALVEVSSPVDTVTAKQVR